MSASAGQSDPDSLRERVARFAFHEFGAGFDSPTFAVFAVVSLPLLGVAMLVPALASRMAGKRGRVLIAVGFPLLMLATTAALMWSPLGHRISTSFSHFLPAEWAVACNAVAIILVGATARKGNGE